MATETMPYGRDELREVLAILTPQHRSRVAVGVEANRQRHGLSLHAAIRTTAVMEATNATLLGADPETVEDCRMAVWAVGLAGAGLL